MATYKKQLKDQNGDNIIPALGTATVTSTNIDWTTTAQSYSTTEVDTGATWIDGKHIYKKTFVVPIPSSGNIVDFQHGINNLEFYVKAEGVAVGSNGTTIRFLPDFYIENDSINGTFGCAIYGGSVMSSAIDITYGSWYRGGTVYVTIWYTKTTDLRRIMAIDDNSEQVESEKEEIKEEKTDSEEPVEERKEER